MKTLLGLMFVTLYASFAGPAENLRIFDKTKNAYVVVDLINHDGITLTASCKKGSRFDCDALKAKPIQDPKLSKVPLLGNPASTYCAKLGGSGRILLDAKNAEYDFCLFNDGSMADSWQLFNKRVQR